MDQIETYKILGTKLNKAQMIGMLGGCVSYIGESKIKVLEFKRIKE